MRIARIGFTPLKGARHAEHPAVELASSGPVGDRAFCLVDRSRARVLRTVENPSLVRSTARWYDEALTVCVDGHEFAGVPTGTGEVLEVDYWGRTARVEVVDGPWAAAYSRHLGYDVVLTAPVRAGEVVFGGSVTLVTTGSMRRLGEELGREVDSARFRATFLVDTDGLDPHVEDSWVGRELRLGGARVAVRGRVPRCAVVDLAPTTGDRDARVLETLGRYRRDHGGILFGVDAVVTAAGRVHGGDPVELGRG